jgi:hypothetical protein
VDYQEHCYSLAAALVLRLAQDRRSFIEFVRHARYEDAGQSAAVDCLGVDLGEIIAPFAGDGECRPNRRAIAQYFAESQNEEDAAQGSGSAAARNQSQHVTKVSRLCPTVDGIRGMHR